MADDDLLVTISGPAFAMLLYENTRIHDQIGFLLGEVLVYLTKKVTDSDRDVEHIKHHINIKSVVSYPLGEPFFNTIGQINDVKLKGLLRDDVKKVVGWYHYRKEFRLVASMRDRNLHNELGSFFSNVNRLLKKEDFIFCLLNSSVNETGGTHKFKHLLLRKQSSAAYKPVSLKITNLGADATRPDGSDYQPTPTSISSESDAFDKVYDSVKEDLKRTKSGVESVTLIEQAAEKLLAKLIPQVTETDKQVSELEMRVALLRNQVCKEQFERAQESSLLEQHMQRMEVDSKSDLQSEARCSTSPEIFDVPKSPMPSSSISSLSSPKPPTTLTPKLTTTITAAATTPSPKQHDGSGERPLSRDCIVALDRDLPLISRNRLSRDVEGSLTPSRLPGDNTSTLRSPKDSGSGTTGGTTGGTRTRQRADQYIQTTTTRSSNRNVRRSPDTDATGYS